MSAATFAPRPVAGYKPRAGGACAFGDKVLVADNGRWTLLDPGAETMPSLRAFPKGAYSGGIPRAAGNVVAMSTGKSLGVWDFSDLDSPKPLATYALTDGSEAATFWRGHVIVPGWSAGVLMSKRRFAAGSDATGVSALSGGSSFFADKTDMLWRLVSDSEDSMFFISRPRRFGKSLMLDTLKCIFEGRRELFGGLKIEKKRYDWKTYPVVMLNMADVKRHFRLFMEMLGARVQSEEGTAFGYADAIVETKKFVWVFELPRESRCAHARIPADACAGRWTRPRCARPRRVFQG